MTDNITLSYLQKYIKDKDYKPELKHAYFLKLIEEIGELSEALNKGKRLNRRIDEEIKGTIDEELYDVLYYVLALANVYDIDMEECFHLKENLNNDKYNRKTNPWQAIDLNTYETHMESKNVYQSQTLSKITKEQLNSYDCSYVSILGIAGGNGLEQVDQAKTKKVYGFDVNQKYLDKCNERYTELSDVMELTCCDLSNPGLIMPFSTILICNLIIEYLGEKNFIKLIKNNRDNLNVVSCVIQKNNNEGFVSNSEHTSALSPIMSIHNNIDEHELTDDFSKIGFAQKKRIIYSLPNGKEFIRLDFVKENFKQSC